MKTNTKTTCNKIRTKQNKIRTKDVCNYYIFDPYMWETDAGLQRVIKKRPQESYAHCCCSTRKKQIHQNKKKIKGRERYGP